MFKERLKYFFYFINKQFFIKNNNFFISINERNFFINKKLIGLKLLLHNGKFYIPIIINDSMINKMLGSFCFSRPIRLKKKIKERLKKK